MNVALQDACRICLQSNAHIPIFDAGKTADTLLAKLSLCLNEIIEDTDGYPRNICSQCIENLDEACAFINKYKESCTILVERLHNIKLVKLENIENVEYHSEHSKDGCSSEVEIYYTDFLKQELEPDNSNYEEISKPGKIKLKRKANASNKVSSTEHKKRQETNIIASSILEGGFVWNGETWSKSSSKLESHYSVNKIVRKPLKKPDKIKIKRENFRKEEQKRIKKLCDICGIELMNADRLKDHIKRTHIAKKWQCTICPKICGTNNDLSRHMKSKHSTERNFVCAICGKCYAVKNVLDKHMKIHHSKDYVKKVFNCSFCPKTYSCKKSVTIHERSVHTGLRPAVCSICDSAFFHEEYLREHMRLHTGETPFKCPVCNRGYAQLGNMKSHIRIHRISEIDSNALAKIKPNYIKLMKH